MIEPVDGLAPLLNTIENFRSNKNSEAAANGEAGMEKNNSTGDDTIYAVKPEEKENLRRVDFTEISQRLQDLLEEDDISIEFSLDKDSRKMILKIIDSRTEQVLQQFPPEITLKIARLAADKLSGGNVTNAKI
ncbi:MAG: flagellar protein FlaG [Candidatus Kapaibacterium sp.]